MLQVERKNVNPHNNSFIAVKLLDLPDERERKRERESERERERGRETEKALLFLIERCLGSNMPKLYEHLS